MVLCSLDFPYDRKSTCNKWEKDQTGTSVQDCNVHIDRCWILLARRNIQLGVDIWDHFLLGARCLSRTFIQ